VNALPLASDRARFVLGKPFSRCFSLVEDHVDAAPVAKDKAAKKAKKATEPVVEKRKKKHASDKHEKPHKSKKAKHKK
jgi:hypothetical protein